MAHDLRLEPGLAGQAPLGSLWQEQTGGIRAKAKDKDKVLEMLCQPLRSTPMLRIDRTCNREAGQWQ